MSDLESIFSSERAKQYTMINKDHFVYETLILIGQRRSKRRRGILLFATILAAIAFISLQLLSFDTTNFASRLTTIEVWIQSSPNTVVLINLAFVFLILGLRKFNWS